MESASGAVHGFLSELFPAECHNSVWLAGGTVRDIVLQRQVKDIDLVAALPASRLHQLDFRPIEGKTTGKIWFRHFPVFGKVEITLIADADALTDDLLRRDFTVNAMLLPLSGELLDPLRGIAALERKELHPCSEATFTCDPLRLIRAFRFVAEGFSLAAETAARIRNSSWDDELQKIPVERFTREMLKAFSAPAPQEFFRCMVEFSVGRCWLPELFRMPQVPAGPPQHHPEGDLLTHSLEVLERVAAASDLNLARFCALFHDIGKLATDPLLYPQHHGHEEAGFMMAERFCTRLALPTEYGRALAWISRLHGTANRIAVLRPATKIRIAEQTIRGGIVDILPLVVGADKAGPNLFTDEWRQVVAVARMNSRELGIDPLQLLAMKVEKRAEFILHQRVEVLKRLWPV